MQLPTSIPVCGLRTTALWLVMKRLPARALMRLLQWHELARQRRALLSLDDRMLKDIGISRAAAEHEARRPLWSAGPAP